jgi:hypothetical protein
VQLRKGKDNIKGIYREENIWVKMNSLSKERCRQTMKRGEHHIEKNEDNTWGKTGPWLRKGENHTRIRWRTYPRREEKHVSEEVKTITQEIHTAYLRPHMKKDRHDNWGKMKTVSEVRLRWYHRKSDACISGILNIIPESVWMPYQEEWWNQDFREDGQHILGKMNKMP